MINTCRSRIDATACARCGAYCVVVEVKNSLYGAVCVDLVRRIDIAIQRATAVATHAGGKTGIRCNSEAGGGTTVNDNTGRTNVAACAIGRFDREAVSNETGFDRTVGGNRIRGKGITTEHAATGSAHAGDAVILVRSESKTDAGTRVNRGSGLTNAAAITGDGADRIARGRGRAAITTATGSER